MPSLDLDFVRQCFPAFAEPSLANTAFMENAGGSYMCADVMQRLDTYFHQLKLQPYHASPAATRAGEWMDASYEALAPWLNVSPESIYFGPSTSQNTYVLAQAVMGWIEAGDEIIVTNQDHEANGGAWRRLADRGVLVKEWQVDTESGKLHIADLQSLLSDKTKLLVFPHCSNLLGDINPVADICTLAREYGVRTAVDGVSFAGHGLPDCQAMGADIYLFSLYKVYGPHQGIMVITPEMKALLSNQSHFFNADERTKCLYPAGPDHAQVAAARGVGEYFNKLYEHHFNAQEVEPAIKAQAVRKLLHDAEMEVLEPLLAYLREHPAVRIIGPATTLNRAPTISVHIAGKDPFAMSKALGGRGIMCGSGHFYSYRLLAAMGLDPEVGILRFSMVHYTSQEDVAKLISSLDDLLH